MSQQATKGILSMNLESLTFSAKVQNIIFFLGYITESMMCTKGLWSDTFRFGPGISPGRVQNVFW